MGWHHFGHIGFVFRIRIMFFSHISRTANVLAHNIAKVHCELGEHRIWMNALPPSICNPDILTTY